MLHKNRGLRQPITAREKASSVPHRVLSEFDSWGVTRHYNSYPAAHFVVSDLRGMSFDSQGRQQSVKYSSYQQSTTEVCKLRGMGRLGSTSLLVHLRYAINRAMIIEYIYPAVEETTLSNSYSGLGLGGL